MDTIELNGSWRYETDPAGVKVFGGERLGNAGFILPGSACENGVGIKQEYYEKMDKAAVRSLRERYEYIGRLWVQREIEIPQIWAEKCISLFLERVNIASSVWIDDCQVDRRTIELSVPHIYRLSGITPGKHLLTICIDNRNLLNLDGMASGYSVDTQGYWNGMIGRIELRCEEVFHIDSIQVYPDADGIRVKVCETSDVHSPFVTRPALTELCITDPDGNLLENKRFETRQFNSKQVAEFRYDMENIRNWDEFHPNLYTLTVKYTCEGITDEKTVRFGMRTIKTENKKILLNGRQIALRGTTDCAIYPLTGYPPTDLETWRRNLSVIKSYGMNHVRFHAWCPPENAFNAADELGIYVSVEMPLWLNRDVCALELGEDSIHRAHFLNAALNISRTFGNHPSFIMFSNGNENMGDFELLNDITTCVKAYDSRRIYTLTSNFDHPVLPCEDYLCAYEAGGHPIRIQNIQDEAAKDTCLDYSQAVSDVPVPIISFEVGQYCVYPDVDSLDKFSGCMMPVNFAAIRKDMQEKGVYDRLADYIKASGDLAVKLYKEDIEAALRTKDFGGIELLSLCDYTGQSTATIGILDVFMDSKGLITPEKFREFCNAVVPLFKAKRIFTNRETFEAELDLYDFGDTKMTVPQYHVTIRLHGRIFYETTTRDTKISVPLDTIDRSSQLDVTVEVGEYRNSWRIFVFAENTENYDVKYIRTPQELEEIKRTGGRAIVTKDCFENAIDGSFIPVFWSPVHFPSPRPCGSIIDETHPALAKFPTGRYPDYQWKRLLDHSVSMDISKIDGAQPIVETVPNFFNNVYSSSLFEVKAGNAELLFCGFDLDGDYPESRALKASIEKYCSA